MSICSAPVDAAHQKFLQFQWVGITYQFYCLLCRLSGVSCTFTQLMKLVLGEENQIYHICWWWPNLLLQESRYPNTRTPGNTGAEVILVLRINHQIQEVTTDANPRVDIILRLAYFNGQHCYLTAQGKTEQNSMWGQEFTPKITSDSTKNSSFCGDDRTGDTYKPFYHWQLQALINRIIPHATSV